MSGRSGRIEHNVHLSGQVTKGFWMMNTMQQSVQIATSGGTAYHIVKAHDRRKDGHAAWRDLCQWFDGDAMKNETADNLRAKLESYRMTSSTGVQQYINSFMTTYRELNNIPGEGWSAGHTKSVFLKGIQDPDYDTFVAI